MPPKGVRKTKAEKKAIRQAAVAKAQATKERNKRSADDAGLDVDDDDLEQGGQEDTQVDAIAASPLQQRPVTAEEQVS
jgi:hypothetical protein